MKKIETGTIIRTALLVLTLINTALAIAGKSPLPIEDTQLESAISYVLSTAAALVAWWKNNSFTQTAVEADEYLKEIKEGK